MRMRVFVFVCAALLASSLAEAATITGVVSDATGAVLPGARVVLRDVATGKEIVVQADGDGRYQIDAPAVGTYLVIGSYRGFSDAVRTVVIVRADQKLDVPLPLALSDSETVSPSVLLWLLGVVIVTVPAAVTAQPKVTLAV